MAGLCIVEAKKIRILDPGAGAGILVCAVCERLALGDQKPTNIMLEAFAGTGTPPDDIPATASVIVNISRNGL